MEIEIPWSRRCHPLLLGTSRNMADFGRTYRNYPHIRELLIEIADSEKNPNKDQPYTRHFVTHCFYGRKAAWPPFDPGSSLNGFRAQIRDRFFSVCELWRTQYLAINTRGPQIFEVLRRVNDNMVSGVTLESLLEKSWRDARQEFNRTHAMQATGVFPGFMLDPDSKMNQAHGSDLDDFSLNFLNDIITRVDGAVDHYPLYRNGANWSAPDQIFGHPTASWNNIKVPERSFDGQIPFNLNVIEHLQKIRAHYLAPHINLDDLSNLLYLFSFMYWRGTMSPVQFIPLDTDLTYLGRSAKILAGAYCYGKYITFHVDDPENPQLQDEDFGFKFPLEGGPGISIPRLGVKIESFDDHVSGTSARMKFAPMEAWVAMNTQTITYLFLDFLISNTLQLDPKLGSISHIPENRPAAKDNKLAMMRNIMAQASVTGDVNLEFAFDEFQWSWEDFVSLRQYRPCPEVINIELFTRTATSKLEMAEDHLGRLFSDPEYFVEKILEQKEHHWANLSVDYELERTKHMEKYDSRKFRHELYYDLVRRLIRRAVFNYFIWNLLLQKLSEMAELMDQRKKNPAASQESGTPLPHDDPRFLLPIIVRYCAVLFLKEFRAGLIHASSPPIRDHYTRLSHPTERTDLYGKAEKCPFPKGLYKAPDYAAKPNQSTMHINENDMPRMVGELINNFMANEGTSMYVGVHRVTDRLRRYLDDVGYTFAAASSADKKQTEAVFTDYVADTIDSLDVLAGLAQHLDDLKSESGFHHVLDDGPPKENFNESASSPYLMTFVSTSCKGHSIDLPHFDEFAYEDNGIPEKRIGRIFRLLDEAQGFEVKITTIGQARGDIKRLGASILRDFMVKKNNESQFKLTMENLSKLETKMGVGRNELIFDPKEKPIDLDVVGGQRAKPLFNRWLGDAKMIKKDNKKRVERLRKMTAGSNKGFDQLILNEAKRQKMMKERQEREIERSRRRAQRRRKILWNERTQDQLVTQTEPEPEPDSQPMDADPAVELAGQVRDQLHVAPEGPGVPTQAANSPPRPQQPLPPVPPRRILPQPPSRPEALAPDGKEKTQLHKGIWETLMSIYGVGQAKVSWADLVKAMNSLGYRDEGRGGSHGVFTWTEYCRWPDTELPKGRNLQLAKNHEGIRSAAARGKTKDWGMRLSERGMDFDFVKRWYEKKK